MSRLGGFVGKEKGAKFACFEKNGFLRAKSMEPRLLVVRRMRFYRQRAGGQGCGM
jgi:hypothetical protein